MAEALTGAFLEIAIVEDPEGTPVETLLTQTTEDVEIERDPEEIDWGEHGNARTQRREGLEAATMTFEMIVTDDQQNLIDTGVLDGTTGEILRNVIHDQVVVYVYTDDAAATPSATYFANEVQFVYQTTTFPMDDVATVEVEGWIHGSHGYEPAA